MERFLKYKDFLKKLLETPGASGFESNIRELMEEELKIYVDEITTDKVGNLIFIKYGNKEDSPKILLMAHMDEIGLIIKHIDDSGFIYFSYLTLRFFRKAIDLSPKFFLLLPEKIRR